jgi:hypothetical protein
VSAKPVKASIFGIRLRDKDKILSFFIPAKGWILSMRLEESERCLKEEKEKERRR